MSINSKQKGKAGELELVKKLAQYGYETRRSVQYNGRTEEGEADLIGLPGIHIECKRVEKLNIDDALEQADRDNAGKRELSFYERILPAVFHRKNRKKWKVTMYMEDFIELYREWSNGRC